MRGRGRFSGARGILPDVLRRIPVWKPLNAVIRKGLQISRASGPSDLSVELNVVVYLEPEAYCQRFVRTAEHYIFSI
jgi:hypothetical protein